MFKDIEDLKVEITKFQDNLISTNGLVEKVSSIILIGSQNNILAEKLLLHINEMILKNDDEFAKIKSDLQESFNLVKDNQEKNQRNMIVQFEQSFNNLLNNEQEHYLSITQEIKNNISRNQEDMTNKIEDLRKTITKKIETSEKSIKKNMYTCFGIIAIMIISLIVIAIIK